MEGLGMRVVWEPQASKNRPCDYDGASLLCGGITQLSFIGCACT